MDPLDQKDELTGHSHKERLKTLFTMAEDFKDVDSKEINPTLYALKQVKKRYESAELIATGGMKQIFKVFDARAKRHVALAMMHEDAPEDVSDPFIHEAWLTARLDHPNIITIHDVGVTKEERPYFTMDLKQGISLWRLIERLASKDRKTMALYPREALLQIFIKICDAMAYAHSVKVLHLDLKPANIQIGDFGQVLVCDWGLGRVLGDDDLLELDRKLFNPDLLVSVNLYGQLRGTPGYMAPEQLVEDDSVDQRTDVYGLGCILYSLLTFKRPLSGTTEEIIKDTKAGKVLSPIERTPERSIPKALDAVVMKALATGPGKRYVSVMALRNEVQRYLSGYATKAENAGVLTQLKLFYRRNKGFCISILSSMVLGVVGATWTIVELAQKERSATEARLEAERMLMLYEAGQGELKVLGSRYDESVANIARRFQQGGSYLPAEKVIRAALEEDPDNPLYLYEMGLHYFMLQKFNQALEYFIPSGVKDDVLEMAQKYAVLKADTDLLTPDQMIDIFNNLHENDPLEMRMVLYDQRERLNLPGRAKILEALLFELNPEWTERVFEYDPIESSLKLGGAGLEKVSTMPSVLAGLQPRILDVSGTDVKDLSRELGYPIEVLDISNTPFVRRKILRQMIHLQELTVSPDQYEAMRLNQFPAKVTIHVKE